MVQDATVFALAEGISCQPLGAGEGAVILTIGSGQLYTCNDTTAAFLGVVDGKRTFAEVVEDLHAAFDVSRDALYRDLAELAEALMAEGIVQAGRPKAPDAWH
jgi:pyrroloquinoline quinone biosynthesis protein D